MSRKVPVLLIATMLSLVPGAVWKALVDDLRVQIELGKMEARERVEPLVDRVAEAVAGARHRLERDLGSR